MQHSLQSLIIANNPQIQIACFDSKDKHLLDKAYKKAQDLLSQAGEPDSQAAKRLHFPQQQSCAGPKMHAHICMTSKKITAHKHQVSDDSINVWDSITETKQGNQNQP